MKKKIVSMALTFSVRHVKVLCSALLLLLFGGYSTNASVVPSSLTIDNLSNHGSLIKVCPTAQSHSFVLSVSLVGSGSASGRIDLWLNDLDNSGNPDPNSYKLLFQTDDFDENAFNNGVYQASGTFNLKATDITSPIQKAYISFSYFDYLTNTAEIYQLDYTNIQSVNNTLTISPASATICRGASVLLTAGGADTYNWSTGATTSSINVTPLTTTTYSVSGTKSGCSLPALSSNITVLYTAISAGSNQTLYVDTPPFTLLGSPSGGTWSGPGVTSGGVFTAANAGTGVKTLTYSVQNGPCTFSSSKTITVNALASNTTSLTFSGSNCEVTIPSNSAYNNIGTGNFTVEAWIKTPATAPSSNPFFSNSDTDNGSGITISISNGNAITLKIFQTILNSNTVTLTGNTCYHIAVTRSSGTVYFYLNGVQVGSGTNAGSIADTDLILGGTGDYGSDFVGSIDDVRFWNMYRSQSDIVNNMNVPIPGSTSGLIGYWNLNEGGEVVYDISVTHNNGTLGGSHSSTIPVRSNVSCYTNPVYDGLSFNNNSTVTIPKNTVFDNIGTGNFTIESWIQTPSTIPSQNPVFSNSDTDNGSGLTFSIDKDATGIRFKLKIFRTYSYSSYISMSTSTCYHIAVTRSSGTITFYLNGTSVGTSTNNVSIVDLDYLIGANGDYGPSFIGNINELRLWNIARSQTDIANNQTSILSSTTSGLIGYYRMDEQSGQTIVDASATGANGFLGWYNTPDSHDPLRSAVSCYSADRTSEVEQETNTSALNSNSDLIVYPNPFSDYLQVKMNNGGNYYSIEIDNAMGETIIKDQTNKGDGRIGAQLPPGVYYVKIIDDNQQVTVVKVIKQ